MSVIASPSVRKLAADRGIQIDELARSLGRQTIGREDVLGVTGHSPGTSGQSNRYWDVDHAQWGPVSTEKMSRIATVAAENLSAAQTLIPAVTHHDWADMTRIEATRAALKAEGVRITGLAFHVAVLVKCLREFPRFNASLSADGASLILKDYVHIGIAVDTPHGLSVPVIRNADRMGITATSAAIRDLATRARARKLRPNELGGASMTISNLGGIGGAGFTPIINPPEVAILGLSSQEIRPLWDGSRFEPSSVVPLDLSYDHRVINGADAAHFVVRYRELIRHPDDLIHTA